MRYSQSVQSVRRRRPFQAALVNNGASSTTDFSRPLPRKEPEPYKPQFNDEGYTEAEKMKLNMELIEITYDLFPFLDEEIQPRLGKDSDEILEPKT